MEKNITNQTTPTEVKSAFKFGTEVLTNALLMELELTRFRNVNEYGIERYKELHPDFQPAQISEPWLSTLQSCGDIWPGFMVSMATYWGLYALESPFKKRIPDKVKVAVSVLTGIGAIVAHEGGKFANQSYSVGSLPDVVVGAIGPIAFGGLHMMLTQFMDDTGKDINRLQKELGMNADELKLDGVI